VKVRKELAAAVGDFSGSINSLGASESNKALAACLSHYGQLEKKIQDILGTQVTSDEQNLDFVVDEYLRIVGSAKVCGLSLFQKMLPSSSLPLPHSSPWRTE